MSQQYRPYAELPTPSACEDILGSSSGGGAVQSRLARLPPLPSPRSEKASRAAAGSTQWVLRVLARWDWYDTGVAVLMAACALATAACLAAGR